MLHASNHHDTLSLEATPVDVAAYVANWRPTIDLEAAAAHEAGHTVAARHHGFPVAWVSIDKEFVRNDPVAHERSSKEAVAAGYPTSMVLASELLSPIFRRRRITTSAELALIEGYCIEVFAGPAAELALVPEAFMPALARGDMEQVTAVLAMSGLSRSGQKRMFRRSRDKACAFVDAHDETIRRFATELQARKTIVADDIDRAIDRARKAA